MATSSQAAGQGIATRNRTEILISGFGGQGVIRLGQTLGLAAIRQNLRVTMLKSHGTETRGGYVRAQLVISPTFVDSPVVEQADYFLAFSASAYKRFYQLAPGLILYDPDFVQEIHEEARDRHLCVPATTLSKEHFRNNNLFANSIMLGALARVAGLDPEATVTALLDTVPRFHDQNRQAFAIGLDVGARFR